MMLSAKLQSLTQPPGRFFSIEYIGVASRQLRSPTRAGLRDKAQRSTEYNAEVGPNPRQDHVQHSTQFFWTLNPFCLLLLTYDRAMSWYELECCLRF